MPRRGPPRGRFKSSRRPPARVISSTYAVIGDPIDHTMSPNIHNAAFRELGMDATYIAYRVPAGELEEGIESLKRTGIAGFNVTIPHKVDVMRFLDRTDEGCSAIGAANTVAVDGTGDGAVLKGYNTDMDGFLEPIRRRGIGIAGEEVLLMGAGGAARAIAAGFAKEGAGRMTVVGRDASRTAGLARFARSLGLDTDVAGFGDMPALGGYRFLVNATPVGMGGDGGVTPVDAGQITAGMTVYDIVYRPISTDLLRKAKKAGATTIPGYEMLLGQAARAFEIWHGRDAPYGAMKRALVGMQA